MKTLSELIEEYLIARTATYGLNACFDTKGYLQVQVNYAQL